ncbi:MAG: hypothetical protein AABX11_06205 [Nanoarchaeota archaeon]
MNRKQSKKSSKVRKDETLSTSQEIFERIIGLSNRTPPIDTLNFGGRYRGKMDIEAYRQSFPNGDNLVTTYLSLKRYCPEMAKVFAELYITIERKEMLIKLQDYLPASSARDRERRISSCLSELVKDLDI